MKKDNPELGENVFKIIMLLKGLISIIMALI